MSRTQLPVFQLSLNPFTEAYYIWYPNIFLFKEIFISQSFSSIQKFQKIHIILMAEIIEDNNTLTQGMNILQKCHIPWGNNVLNNFFIYYDHADFQTNCGSYYLTILCADLSFISFYCKH